MISRKRTPVSQIDSRPLEITDDTSTPLDLSAMSVNIDSFEYNKPISIISSTTNQSISYYQEKAILSNTITNWLIEPDISDTSICYIKAAVPSTYGRQYLGAPNSDNKVYLYTSRNCFTQWKMSLMDKDKELYELTYVGRKFDTTHVQLVVARYSEDIRWVRAYKDIAIVYNKGIYHDIMDTLRVVRLENIGREGHTYLHHMISAYDSLKDRTIFSQGDPFSHNDTILFAIDNYEKLDAVMPLGLGYLVNNNLPPQNLLDKIKQKTDYGLEYAIFKINKNCDYMDESYFHDAGALGFATSYRSYYKIEHSSSIIDSMLSRAKFPYFPNNTFYFTFSGLFSVNRDVINAHDIEVYNNLKRELLSENNQGGVNGYLLERLWLHIFNG
jgi:hypothetical protein